MIEDRLFAERSPAWWHAALVLAVALLLQTEVMHFVSLRGAQPSLVLIAVVWYALRTEAYQAAVFGLIAGLFEDIFSARTGAAWTIATAATAYLPGLLSRSFFADSISVVATATAAATLVRRLLFWSVMAMQGYPSGYARLHFHQALWEALLNALIAGAGMLAWRVWLYARTR